MKYEFDKSDQEKNEKTYNEVASVVMKICRDKECVLFDDGGFRFSVDYFYKFFKLSDIISLASYVIMIDNGCGSCNAFSVFKRVVISHDYIHLIINNDFFDHVTEEECLQGYRLRLFFEKLKQIAFKNKCRMSN